MFRKTLIALLASIISFSAFAEVLPFPGYIITYAGDTLHGTIDYGDWNKNPSAIQFTINTETKTFKPGEIRGFGVEGYNEYISANIRFYPGPVSGNSLPLEFPDKRDSGVFFLRKIVPGNYPLYELNTNDRSYFFYGDPEGQVNELIYRVKSSADQMEQDFSYRQQIFHLFEMEDKTDHYRSLIRNAGYNVQDITSLFEGLNGSSRHQTKTVNNAAFVQPEIFLGGMISGFPVSFNGEYARGIKASSSISMTGGFNFLISLPGNFQAFKMGIGMGYNSFEVSAYKTESLSYNQPAQQYTQSYQETVSGKGSVLSGNLYMMAVLNPQDVARAYIKVGGSYHCFINSDRNVYTQGHFELQGVINGQARNESENVQEKLLNASAHYISFLCAAGVIYKRNTFEFSYCPPANYVGNGSYQTPVNNFSVGTIGLIYYYSLTPVKNPGR